MSVCTATETASALVLPAVSVLSVIEEPKYRPSCISTLSIAERCARDGSPASQSVPVAVKYSYDESAFGGLITHSGAAAGVPDG